MTKPLQLSSHSLAAISHGDDEMDGFLSIEKKSDNQSHKFFDRSESDENGETNLDLNGEKNVMTFDQLCKTSSGESGQSDIWECRKTVPIQLGSNININLRSDECGTQKYTTSMYIDSFTPALHVPMQEKTEIMLLLESNLGVTGRSEAIVAKSLNEEGKPRRYQTVLNADVTENFDGRLMLMPRSYKTVVVKTGLEEDNFQRADFNQEVYSQSVYQQFARNAFDVTDHQILYTIMQHSAYVSVSKASRLFLI